VYVLVLPALALDGKWRAEFLDSRSLFCYLFYYFDFTTLRYVYSLFGKWLRQVSDVCEI